MARAVECQLAAAPGAQRSSASPYPPGTHVCTATPASRGASTVTSRLRNRPPAENPGSPTPAPAAASTRDSTRGTVATLSRLEATVRSRETAELPPQA